MVMNRTPSIQDITDAQKAIIKMRFDHWITYEMLTFQWWLLLIVGIVPWIIWWKIADKKRVTELLLFGVILAYLTTALDSAGTEVGIWAYKYKEIPLFNRIISMDITVLPVGYMLIYQYFKGWRSYILVHLLVAFSFAFVFEPLLVWLDIYKPYHWQHLYSFPLYILLAIFMRYFVQKIKRYEAN